MPQQIAAFLTGEGDNCSEQLMKCPVRVFLRDTHQTEGNKKRKDAGPQHPRNKEKRARAEMGWS